MQETYSLINGGGLETHNFCELLHFVIFKCLLSLTMLKKSGGHFSLCINFTPDFFFFFLLLFFRGGGGGIEIPKEWVPYNLYQGITTCVLKCWAMVHVVIIAWVLMSAAVLLAANCEVTHTILMPRSHLHTKPSRMSQAMRFP